jgi:protein arginine N-methyltransferase 1
VTFIQGDSSTISIPERVDVVVCDQMGPFGFEAGLLDAYRDAARRHVRPGGVLIPCGLEFEFAPATVPDVRQVVDVWHARPADIDFDAAHDWAVNQSFAARVAPGQMLGTTCQGASIALAEWDGEPFTMTATSTIQTCGAVDVLVGWFVARLAPGVTISNSPLRRDAINRNQAVLPLAEPIAVEPGDEVDITIKVSPASAMVSWRTQVRGATRRQVVASPYQSTFLGTLLSAEDLRHQQPDARPTLGPRGQARRSVLAWADGTHSLAEIERGCASQYGALFSTRSDVQRFVRGVLDDADY